MARLSAANSAEHIAALKTPDQKGARRSSRFKDLFKSSHVRTSSGSGYTPSPLAMSSLRVDENLKPGFEKVGLHPSERSPVSDTMESPTSGPSRESGLELWKKFDGDREIGDMAEVQLHEEQQQLKQDKDDGDHQVEEKIPNESSRRNSLKARKVLGIESGQEKEDADATGITTEATKAAQAKESSCSAFFHNPGQVTLGDLFGTDSLEVHHGSSHGSTDSIHGIGDPISATRLSIRYSPTSKPRSPPAISRIIELTNLAVEDLRTRAQAQARTLRSNSIAATAGDSNDDCMRDNASAFSQRVRLYFRGLNRRVVSPFGMGLDDTDTNPTLAKKNHTPSRNEVPLTRTSNFGPLLTSDKKHASPFEEKPVPGIFKLASIMIEAPTARALTESLLPFTYTIILCSAAFQGPLKFCLAVWKILAAVVAYIGVRKLMCWDEDGSCDVLLAPIEDLAQKAKECSAQVMKTFLTAIARAIIEASRELDAGDRG